MTDWFNNLYKEYYSPVCRYFQKRYAESEAEDMAQETFMRLWAWAGCGNNVRNAKSLVFSVAKSVLCDRLRQRDLLSNSEQIDELLNVQSSDNIELAFEMAQILLSLTEEERTVVEMKNMGYKSAEIGKKLGVSASAVRTRYQAIRKKLKDYM